MIASMSIDFDFLAQQQPTEFTVRALWHLHHFAQGGKWENGFAFEKQLRACQLDYTIGSLQRIDHLLDQIRKLKPNPATFFKLPENQQFLFTLAFYCGEIRGRLLQIAPVWYNWQAFMATHQDMQSVFPNVVEHELVAHFPTQTHHHTYFPLVAILARLFPQHDHSDSSVYFSTLTQQAHEQYDLNDPLPKPPIQSLHFDLPSALSATPTSALPYLQILPPKWIHSDELITQIRATPKLYNHGKVVWAALVKAPHRLFQHNDPISLSAQIIYDKSGRTPAATLREWANELSVSQHTEPTQYTAHINHMDVRYTSVFVWRLHLPNAILTLPIFPIIIADDCDDVMLLPAQYWAETSFYRDWLREQALQNDQHKQPAQATLSSQEIISAFRHYVQQHNDFWAGYTELLSPQAEELPQLGTNIIHTHPIIQYETDQSFLAQCRDAAQSEYLRWHEFQVREHHLDEANHDVSTHQQPETVYQQLRHLDTEPFLSLLTEPPNHPTLTNSQPLTKIASILQHRHLQPIHIAKIVQFLRSQGTLSSTESPINTTATLYLALLYLTGTFVPQTIEEGIDWLNLAMDLGDHRAARWAAELLIHIPELAPTLCKQKLMNEMSEWSFRLMNASTLGHLPFSILPINGLEHAYIHHGESQAELTRHYFESAAQLGDTSAKTRLAELINQNRLPAHAREPRFQNLQWWLIDDFAQHGMDIRPIFSDILIAENDTANQPPHHVNHLYHSTQFHNPKPSQPSKKWLIWIIGIVIGLATLSWFATR